MDNGPENQNGLDYFNPYTVGIKLGRILSDFNTLTERRFCRRVTDLFSHINLSSGQYRKIPFVSPYICVHVNTNSISFAGPPLNKPPSPRLWTDLCIPLLYGWFRERTR